MEAWDSRLDRGIGSIMLDLLCLGYLIKVAGKGAARLQMKRSVYPLQNVYSDPETDRPPVFQYLRLARKAF